MDNFAVQSEEDSSIYVGFEQNKQLQKRRKDQEWKEKIRKEKKDISVEFNQTISRFARTRLFAKADLNLFKASFESTD